MLMVSVTYILVGDEKTTILEKGWYCWSVDKLAKLTFRSLYAHTPGPGNRLNDQSRPIPQGSIDRAASKYILHYHLNIKFHFTLNLFRWPFSANLFWSLFFILQGLRRWIWNKTTGGESWNLHCITPLTWYFKPKQSWQVDVEFHESS